MATSSSNGRDYTRLTPLRLRPARAISLDPNTGDADDHQGKPPRVYQRTVPVWVPEPGVSALGVVSIAALAVRARRRTTPRAR